ncbi:ATP-binding cassette domain-containing protein [Paraburkholderia unamae]|uniref:Monosaccharide ABC transporter ATP-binding protein (CUT2 family) n=1 Tax=Paraburkholderia unamae TaxID=219649 RepID=A0ABX5KBE6_9BURK|nr:ATP-binding cassette domain-containing protein [Paraburkholderia unamae]PVX68705.1 monosaccharide ABC transporter ATP-binding protein (CUT2 family) [Paraburkholderia unamae]RAR49918.1 monosaccharide ABC transporter ATP-binding protein (CUT2 family) [Paraburkholderia unamae]CAG9274666.1 Inositol transport system ATP-binding protein [Paraburkholderia unamae]
MSDTQNTAGNTEIGDTILALENVSKYFGKVIALNGVTLRLRRGEVHCLLGDNGAGKSTLIKTLAGVHQPTSGQYFVDGKPVAFDSPKDALDLGIATVYQDLALVPLLSVARNFFMGREPQKKLFGFINVMDLDTSASVAKNRLAEMGINVRDPHQAIGTMSGGEKQCLAIARAIHFGARVLILDEPTAALGVKQSFNVLKLIHAARAKGISVIFITHNVHHAYPIGDSFTLLNRGKSLGTYTKDTISKNEVLDMMAGGAEMQKMIAELDGATI